MHQKHHTTLVNHTRTHAYTDCTCTFDTSRCQPQSEQPQVVNMLKVHMHTHLLFHTYMMVNLKHHQDD